ncbi:C40 family peptidase, partial [Octadecabacter sp.]|nr:C40 family peptidase [Octadecabacter sp.]
GVLLTDDALLQRGDLVFWKGHVAMMVDGETMIHANAHHMAVVYEGLARATMRIKAQGDGDVLACRRVL